MKDDRVTLNKNIETIDYAILMALKFIDFSIDASKPFETEIEKIYKFKR